MTDDEIADLMGRLRTDDETLRQWVGHWDSEGITENTALLIAANAKASADALLALQKERDEARAELEDAVYSSDKLNQENHILRKERDALEEKVTYHGHVIEGLRNELRIAKQWIEEHEPWFKDPTFTTLTNARLERDEAREKIERPPQTPEGGVIDV